MSPPMAKQARALATEFEYDLVVLDLNLPRLDGVAILRHLRTRKPSLPILVLTARGRVEDRVLCLDAGADDYWVKPFSFSEPSARIRALFRRNRLPSESVLIVEDLKLDRVERPVTRGTRMIELTSKEFALLEYLMRNAGRRVTRAMIIEDVWNLSFHSATNLVDVYVAYSPNSLTRGVRHCRPKLRANAQRHAVRVTCPVSTLSSQALRSPPPSPVFPTTVRPDRPILVVVPANMHIRLRAAGSHWRTFFLRFDASQFFPIEGIAWKLLSQTA